MNPPLDICALHLASIIEEDLCDPTGDQPAASRCACRRVHTSSSCYRCWSDQRLFWSVAIELTAGIAHTGRACGRVCPRARYARRSIMLRFAREW